MIYPSIDEITRGRFNRYMLCIATAKCARNVTDDFLEQKEEAIRLKDDKTLSKLVSSTEKPVKTAINLIYEDKYKLVIPDQQ
ncbi:MAG: hypothetical protein IJO74_01730 [Clostridia bacterium]|nr:hypothetical protein [Clostridia bacterium]